MARVIDKISISIMAGGGSVRIAREQQNSRGRETVEAREGERGEDDFDASPSRQPCGVITRLAEHGGGSSGAFGSSSPLSSPRSFPLFNFSSLPFSLFLSLSVSSPSIFLRSFFDLSSNFSSTLSDRVSASLFSIGSRIRCTPANESGENSFMYFLE